MAESREERLARIQASLDRHRARNGDGRTMAVYIDDVEWLLSQVSGELEYRVEALSALPDEMKIGEWFPYNEPGETHPEISLAREAVSIYASLYPWRTFRVASAPVQVWTIEEETP